MINKNCIKRPKPIRTTSLFYKQKLTLDPLGYIHICHLRVILVEDEPKYYPQRLCQQQPTPRGRPIL